MSTKEKNEKTIELKQYHQKVFDALGETSPVFLPKPPFKPLGLKEKAVPMFSDQLRKLNGRDVYFEFVDRDNMEPEPDQHGNLRTLWRWKYDAKWKNYHKHVSAGGVEMYMIPVSILHEVNKNVQLPISFKIEGSEVSTQIVPDVKAQCPDPNRKITDMTVGDLQCLLSELVKVLKS